MKRCIRDDKGRFARHNYMPAKIDRFGVVKQGCTRCGDVQTVHSIAKRAANNKHLFDFAKNMRESMSMENVFFNNTPLKGAR